MLPEHFSDRRGIIDMYYVNKCISIFLFITLFGGCVNWFSSNRIKPYSFSNGKYELSIRFAKEEFKVFEPVLAEFTLVNHDTLPLLLRRDFTSSGENTSRFIFLDKDNHVKTSSSKYFERAFIMYDTVPNFFLHPGDTLYSSMIINNWGIALDKKSISNASYFFNSWGYFPKGIYRLYYEYPLIDSLTGNRSGVSLFRSNETTFSVIENNIEEKYLLKQVLDSSKRTNMIDYYERIIKQYPANEFREHFFYEYIKYKYSGYRNAETLVFDYEKFISEFPESSYLLLDDFMYNYIYALIKDFKDVNTASKFVRSRITNAKILKFISHTNRLQNIVIHKWH